MAHLEKDKSYMLKKIDDLENRSRRNNLLVYGLEEKGKEKPVSLQNKVKKEL